MLMQIESPCPVPFIFPLMHVLHIHSNQDYLCWQRARVILLANCTRGSSKAFSNRCQNEAKMLRGGREGANGLTLSFAT